MLKNEQYIEHSSIECHGVDIVDTSNGRTLKEQIWVGVKSEGSWMASGEVRELVTALISTADSHDARLAGNVAMPDCLENDLADQLAADPPRMEAELREDVAKFFRITHHYDIGNQDLYVERVRGDVDAKRAAVYCQFKCEEWFGIGSVLTNLGVAAMLAMFYGFRQAAVMSDTRCTEIDMYSDRESSCGDLYLEMMADASLHRDSMRDCMATFLD